MASSICQSRCAKRSDSPASCPLVGRRPVVLGEYVHTEIALWIAPDRVDVVDVPLRVVVLQHEAWPLNAVVVRLPSLERARPRKRQAVEPIVGVLGDLR